MTRDLSGRVELTWTNKQKRLITLETIPEGERYPYRWVQPSDYRVAEVRLLSEVARVGDDTTPENYLIRGDALHALTSLRTPSAGPADLTGKVKLAYLDPPFNTGKTFDAYEDNLEKSIYLTMMRDRLDQVARLMRPDGSVWLHCDDSMMAQLRLIMDEVFTESAFVATIVWQKRTSRENRKAIGSGHDYIHVYAMCGPQAWAKVRNKIAKDGQVIANPDNDPNGPWRSIPFTAQGFRANQMYPITTPTGVVHLPPKGRCWSKIEDRYKEFLDAGRIYFPKGGDGKPRVKEYGEIEGLAPMSWWSASEVGDNDEGKKEILDLFPDQVAFSTPKPERLMRRIIEISTNPGDLVLDPFAGSATTAAVAHKLDRRWATVEFLRENVERYDLPRLTQIVAGKDTGGISEDLDWQGGGGFSVLDVEPSMFDDAQGITVLADWAVSGALGEAVAVQLGFTSEVAGPFCGWKGRTKLAVIDGLVNKAVADLIIAQLDAGATALICGTGLDPEVAPYLASTHPGSNAQLIPQAILGSYGRPRRWTPTIQNGG